VSLWTATAAEGDGFAPLDRDRSVDVAVIGAGLAGLLTAVRLQREGAAVLVLERARIASGVTANTTAKVTALHGTIYQQLRSSKGADAAQVYGQANLAAIEELAELASSLEIACEFTRASAWTYATSAEGRSTVEAEVDAAQAAGLPASFEVPDELPFPTAGGVEVTGQAHFQPVSFCQGVAAALPPDTIHEQSAVCGVDEDRGAVTVRTASGHRVRAEHAVVTTHAPVVDPAFLTGRMRPSRSYAAAVEVVDHTVPEAMYLSVESPTRSLRPATRDGRPVLVVGGHGHTVGDADTAEHQAQLESWARTLFDVRTVTDRWSAHDHITSDGIPFIGRLTPRDSRRWVATGFGKWGMTTSAVAAAVIADGIAGRTNPWADLFNSTRLAPTVTRSLIQSTARVGRRFVGDRIQARRAGAHFQSEHLAPGDARVVHIGGQPTAISRDLAGDLHSVSAKCTHLGCLVTFNRADQTWDCPCHGSRFSTDGRVLTGPATTPLTPRPLDVQQEDHAPRAE
jgi:glycine/D-amino acid oxidase-like deaminating enzyme/nitrite reductase/ring-hydroxylating ferredoxin subunit